MSRVAAGWAETTVGDREQLSRKGAPNPPHNRVLIDLRHTRESARLQRDPKGSQVLITRLQQGLEESWSPELKRKEQAPSTRGSMQVRREARREEGALPSGVPYLGIHPELRQSLPMPHERINTLEEGALLDQAIDGAKSAIRQRAQGTQDQGVTRQHGGEPQPQHRDPTTRRSREGTERGQRGVAATRAKAGRRRWVSTLVDA